MKKVQLTTEGIKKHLSSITPSQAIAEYIWNALDAKATLVNVVFGFNELGGVYSIEISDNGTGIPYENLENEFGVFLDSEKIKQRKYSKRISSETHGKDGIGRLTFFVFSQMAEWSTVYEKDSQKYQYKINVSSDDLCLYPAKSPKEIDGKVATGTKVTFKNINGNVGAENDELKNFLISEFCWRLVLQDNLKITINGVALDPKENIDDDRSFCLVCKKDRPSVVRYIRWKNKLRQEYSRYYFLDSLGKERFTDFTSLNKKGDGFCHSVYIKSAFFDNFFPIDGSGNQGDLALENTSKKDEWFKNTLRDVDAFLRAARKEFLRRSKDVLISKFLENGVFPAYDERSPWEELRHKQLADTVGELYNIQPNVFGKGSLEQKKIFVRLIDQLLDSAEAEKIYQIIDQVLDLDSEEKSELIEVLRSSKLNSIVSTIKLIQDRYRAIEQIKLLNWEKGLRAKEVPHIQEFMERHFWILGEEYSMVVAAEKDFEQALRLFYEEINIDLDSSRMNHPDKNKEMDVFLVRQDKRHNKIHCVVLELKHPDIRLGKKQVDQVERYFGVILSDPRFNASNMEWSYYLIGNEFDNSSYIDNMMENARPHGEPSLIFKARNHRIYVKRWSEIIADVTLRHDFLNDRLRIQRDQLANEEKTAKSADEVLVRSKLLSCSIQ